MGTVGGFALVHSPVPHPGHLPVEIVDSKLYRPAIGPGVVPGPSVGGWLRRQDDRELRSVRDRQDIARARRGLERAARAATGAGRPRGKHDF